MEKEFVIKYLNLDSIKGMYMFVAGRHCILLNKNNNKIEEKETLEKLYSTAKVRKTLIVK